jgi:hypothetical protein
MEIEKRNLYDFGWGIFLLLLFFFVGLTFSRINPPDANIIFLHPDLVYHETEHGITIIDYTYDRPTYVLHYDGWNGQQYDEEGAFDIIHINYSELD